MLHSLGLPLLGAAAGVSTLALAWHNRQAGRARLAARHGYFEACLPLFDSPVKSIAPHGFARISGRYHGRPFDLQALPDTLSYRKLPALWLLVTLPAPMPVAATLDVMQRPGGGEVFSHFATLPVQLPAAPGLPGSAVLRTDDPARLPPESILHSHAGLFDSSAVKELLISPRGLRIVILAEEADRGRYLLFRDAEMGMSALSRATLVPFLDRLVAIAGDLENLSATRTEKTA